jgi:hypothetical protein
MSRLYLKSSWRHPVTGLRATKLRNNPLCEICQRDPAVDVHHKTPHNDNLTLFHDYTNLQSLCHPCHSRITGQTYGTGPRKRFPKGGVDANGRVRDPMANMVPTPSPRPSPTPEHETVAEWLVRNARMQKRVRPKRHYRQ